MDWIETMFGISPDGGSGATELLYVAGVALAVALIIGRRKLTSAFKDLSAKR
jgi:hypothetical protein